MYEDYDIKSQAERNAKIAAYSVGYFLLICAKVILKLAILAAFIAFFVWMGVYMMQEAMRPNDEIPIHILYDFVTFRDMLWAL